ncbi:MAG: GNAT family N-acetyltransferase [Parcubacteria group bacterium]
MLIDGLSEFMAKDADVVSSWVRDAQEAELIGARRFPVSPQDIVAWTVDVEAYVFLRKLRPVAFATLTAIEAPGLPERQVEICHFIVNPECRRKKVATRFMDLLSRVAFSYESEAVVGRAVPENVAILRLLAQPGLGFLQFTDAWTLHNGLDKFSWFQRQKPVEVEEKE